MSSEAASPWLSIVGIGENGLDGLGADARAAIEGAALVAGGARHLALAAPALRGETLPWPRPIEAAFPALLARRGQPVAVLASGDPFLFGVGAPLAAIVPAAERRCLPAPSCVSLACAQLGWAAQEVAVASFCGRPVAAIRPLLQPGARLLALSADASTPALFAALLRDRGFSAARLCVMESLGGPRERVRALSASAPMFDDLGPLNMVAAELPGAGACAGRALPVACGLADAWFEHDGQITKADIRALTLAALAPRAGELLWDIGGGSGSVSVEWMLRHPRCRAVALEPDPARAARIARNAEALGTPGLRVVPTAAPEGLRGLPPPDAVFVGGGVATPGVLEAAWAALRPGGRMVTNGVTQAAELRLAGARAALGGCLSRLRMERLEPLGGHAAFRPALPVTQWAATKPC